MDDSELAEQNYKKGVRNLKYTKTVIDAEANNIHDIRELITYKVDGDILISIEKKLTKASRQINYMISRFDDLEGEVMIPKRKL